MVSGPSFHVKHLDPVRLDVVYLDIERYRLYISLDMKRFDDRAIAREQPGRQGWP
jgi:hypothetical protein